MKPAIAVAAFATLFVAACHSEATREKIANMETNQQGVASTPSPAAPAPFLVEQKDDMLDFTYGWPAEAAAVPELADRFQKAMAKWKAELATAAAEGKALSQEQGREFNGYMGSMLWTTSGQSPRLLSLVGETESYTGGAHGNRGSVTLLWDRAAKREIKLADLFSAPASRDALLRDRWCTALDKAREEKRGAPVGDDGMFDQCPALSEISIAPSDQDGDGRFERLTLIADPYVAGPWSEGDYIVELPVTPPLIAALKPDYRAGFVAAQPQ